MSGQNKRSNNNKRSADVAGLTNESDKKVILYFYNITTFIVPN